MLNSSHINPNIIKALWRQQQELLRKSPEYVTPIINPEDPLDIQFDLEGPKATPYENGIFRVKLIITPEFPLSAPKGIFITKIFHPNISEKGDICVNALKKDWNPSQWNLYTLFEIIKCLLIIPFPQSALNEEAGKLFMENYEEYFKIAKMYTNIYAMKNNNNQNILEQKIININENNDDDIDMEDNSEKINEMNRDINMNNMSNNYNYSQSEMKINGNNSHGNIEHDIVRRRSEIPRSNYNLNNINYFIANNDMNKYNDETKRNNNFMCKGINNCDNNNFINNINSINVSNNLFSNCISSKEKPNLSFLPLMQANQIKNNNNIFGYHRSFTDINISNNNRIGNGYNNNSKEINKWIMRI